MSDKEYLLPVDITDGPWRVRSRSSPGWRIEGPKGQLIAFSKDNPYNAPNAEFIAWARNNIQDIINENEILKKQNIRMQKQTAQVREIYSSALEIRNWLKASEQPDTLITQFEKTINDAGIFRESEM